MSISQHPAALGPSSGGVGGFRWHVSKAGLILDVHSGVLQRIVEDYASRGNLAWGMLLGAAPGEPAGRRHIEVNDCIELDGVPGEFGPETRQLAETFARSHAATAIGVYLAPKPEDSRPVGDLILAAVGNLKAPLAVVMALQPDSGGQLTAEFNLRVAGDSLSNIHKTTTVLTGAAAGEPIVIEERKSNFTRWQRIAILVAVSVLVAGLAASLRFFRASTPAAPPPAPARAVYEQPARAGTGLDVFATRRGNGLEVTWNAEAPAARAATGGVLFITDGQQRTQVPLDRRHLEAGRVVYAARTNDVDLRLELIDAAGVRTGESLRVLGAGRRPESAPAPVPGSYPAGTARIEPAAQPAPASRAPEPPAGAAEVTTTTESAPVPGSAGFTAADVLEKVPVNVPAHLRSALTGEVRAEVRVRIDETGRVVAAETAVADSSPLTKDFAELARNTALRWRFAPARQGGQPVPSDYTIVFRFHK